jgi:hypothetical protein
MDDKIRYTRITEGMKQFIKTVISSPEFKEWLHQRRNTFMPNLPEPDPIHEANESEESALTGRIGDAMDEEQCDLTGRSEMYPHEVVEDDENVLRRRSRFITDITKGSIYKVADPLSTQGQLHLDDGKIHTEDCGRERAVELMDEQRVRSFERRLLGESGVSLRGRF